MKPLEHKIDFAMLFSVDKANPNGDPLDGNRPRTNYEGFGEVSDVCIKRKIRNRLQDEGHHIFVQSNDRADDGHKSLRQRADGLKELGEAMKTGDYDACRRLACREWLDVRAFGQVFAFKKNKAGKKKDIEGEEGEGGDENADSFSVRGPISIRTAVSIDPVDVTSMQITKSVNLEYDPKNPDKKGSDTMGMKHRVDFGLYKVCGSINVQLAEKTGFSKEDAEDIKDALLRLFENDASSARPDGSMEVVRLCWWEHGSKLGQYPSARVHELLKAEKKPGVEQPRRAADYDITVEQLPGLTAGVFPA